MIRRLSLLGVLGVVVVVATGCEGFKRKHDYTLIDVNPPELNAPPKGDVPEDVAQLPDMVEQMHASRLAYIEDMRDLEKNYLLAGDSTKANWARRQRQLTEDIEIYPYLTASAPEKREEVKPVETIGEADKLYNDGVSIVNELERPVLGMLEKRQEKGRQALGMFKKILRDYPTSDKVDDSAFYCGMIYKEYLREDDPNNELALRYYKWAVELDPATPHPARFDAAVIYEFRLRNRARALELYNEVIEVAEAGDKSNQRWAADRIEALTAELRSPNAPRGSTPVEPQATVSGPDDEGTRPGSTRRELP